MLHCRLSIWAMAYRLIVDAQSAREKAMEGLKKQ
ncbi:hypothetical protein CBA19CS42_34795 [Caballeronia novacaledonica]|uniref:Uncharacterized protein n=1 Tax=Caballeronia novacaledonica TaxID=1544861 RepID=A0AA37IIC3_9BURK|nr:hypothetical protein CBA19CS42_34795 [Caballeronia novacaledonica]